MSSNKNILKYITISTFWIWFAIQISFVIISIYLKVDSSNNIPLCEGVKTIIDGHTSEINYDSLNYANQIGRLDSVTLLLALFGIIIGIVAILGVGIFRREAKETAREETKVIAKDILNQEARKYLTKHFKSEKGKKLIEEFFASENGKDLIIKVLQYNMKSEEEIMQSLVDSDEASASKIAELDSKS